MKEALMIGAFAGAVVLGTAVRAHEAPAPDYAVMANQAATVEGCLQGGMRDGEFSVSDARERYTVIPVQGVELAAHVNHQVQLSGTVEKSASATVFRASAVKMVAATCSAAP